MTGWPFLIVTGVLLALSHMVPSAPAVRPWLRAQLGAAGFQGAYAVLSTATFAAFVAAYMAADSGPQLYWPIPGARLLAVITMPLVVAAIVLRLTTRLRRDGELLAPRGIYLITRAPGAVAVLTWATLHLLNTGDAKRVFTFAIMAAIGLFALIKNEYVLRQDRSEVAEAWRRETRILPFAAMARGAKRPRTGDIGWWPLAASLVIYGALVWLHPIVLGADPLLGIVR
jgi:uncharacterized membrane protein